MAEVIGIGMLGCGIVGSAVARMLAEHAEELTERVGAQLELRKVCVRDRSKPRDIPQGSEIITDDVREVLDDPDVRVIVEVMGGIQPTRELLLTALRSGKSVVSANKELIAQGGQELFDAAESAGVDFLFEASVAGGIPIIKPLKESLAGDRINRVMGIVNGTTNFILTQMSERGLGFREALAEADALGYTELDPSADIEGFDAAAKIAILASIAFNARVVAGDVYREGISSVTQRDIAMAATLGFTVKLLGIAERVGTDVAVRVHPAMIPSTHPLATVRDNLNAVFVEGDQVGELMFYGRGAGGPPTATSVVGDLVDVARNIVTGGRSVGCTCYRRDASIRPMAESYSQYYVLLEVKDKAGVLAQVARCFADHDVSIMSVWQEGFGEEARLVMVTHTALEKNFQALLKELERLDAVEEVASAMRVESAES